MRIQLLAGGLILLTAAPVAAQESADSIRVFAAEAGTPAAPTMQVMLVAGVVAFLVLRQWVRMRNGAGVLKF